MSSEPNYGLVIAGGLVPSKETTSNKIATSSIENFPGSNLCSIPDLPTGRAFLTLSMLKPKAGPPTLVVCGGEGHGDSCLSWQKGARNWSSYATLDPPRVDHNAVSFGDRLLLVGGSESPKTGVELPSGRELSLSYNVKEACLISLTDGFIVTGGIATGTGSWSLVQKYSSTGEFIELLPSFTIGRRRHACGTFEDEAGRAVLLITGGYGFENRNGLNSTELLRSDSDGKWTSWTAGEPAFT